MSTLTLTVEETTLTVAESVVTINNGGGGGGGASAFIDLTDVPGAYTGAAGQFVKVNETEDGLEFEVIEAADLPSAIDAAKIGDGTVSNAEFQTLNGAQQPYTTAEQTKLAGIETGAEVNDNAAEILTKLLTVDGAGSGLDADLLDGNSSAAFAAALGADDNYVTDAEKVKLSNLSGTNTGDQTSIVGITGTKAEFDTAVTDGNFMYIGDAPTAHTHPQSEITNLVSDLAAKAADSAVVHNTGAENVGGVKTFTDDPIIPDEVYGAGWNGSLEPPTKNAVYDEMELRVQKSAVPCEFIIACSDETTSLTTGNAKVTFRAPYAFTVTAVRASVTTAPTGATLTVDINENTGGGATSILSTKLTIDVSEKTSTTAATPAVISDSAIADDSEMTIDIDQVGSTIAGAGLKVTIIGTHAI